MADNEIIEELKVRAQAELTNDPSKEPFLGQVLRYITQISKTHNRETELLQFKCSEAQEISEQITKEVAKLKSNETEQLAEIKQLREANAQLIKELAELKATDEKNSAEIKQLQETNTQLAEKFTELKSNEAERLTAMKQIQSDIKDVTKSARATRRTTAGDIVKMLEKGKDMAAIAKKYKTGGEQ